MARSDNDQQPEGYREEPAGGYEDPAQRPAAQSNSGRRGRPQGTLFVGVIVLLFGGLVILGVLGYFASR